jgi:predicted nuclease with TOPRIM domain
MDEVQRRLEEMSGSVQDAEELEERLRQKQADCARLEKEMGESRRRQRKEALERLSRGKVQLEESSAKHDEALALLSQRREELRHGRFGLREPEELETPAKAAVTASSRSDDTFSRSGVYRG